LASKYLSYADRTGEIAFAVIMVVIINGYVALSQLNTGFVYIVAVNIGACLAWGIIDGLIYTISSSIERNTAINKLATLKKAVNKPDILNTVKNSLDDTFLTGFDKKGKEAIAREIVTHVPNVTFEENKAFTKKEILGGLSIVVIYLTVGFLLALPFLVLHDKVLAWFISNGFGVGWLFWYGMQLGKAVGKNRWVFGVLLAVLSVSFLVWSYFINAA
jgi:VIT1/CCC1 family predicted Fe2+/Mn2+ transporter